MPFQRGLRIQDLNRFVAPTLSVPLQLTGRVKALGVTPSQATRFVLAGRCVEGRVALAEAVVRATRIFRTSRGR